MVRARVTSRRLGPTALLALAALCACDAEDPCVDGSMLDSAQGLVVTEAEHPAAWGRQDCWECHVAAEIHRTGCTPDVDLAAIGTQVQAEGTASCASCHGPMGTPEAGDAGDATDTGAAR